MTYIPDADLIAPPLCPECGLETVWSGFDYECPVVVGVVDYEYVMPPDEPTESPPLCPECGAEMYEDRGRYDWVCPTRYHAADIENYSGEPDPVDEDSPDGQ